MNFSKFEKCSIKPGVRGSNMVRLNKTAHSLTIPRDIAEAAALRPGDRVDLYKYKKIFALMPCSVGCLTCREPSNAGKSLLIRSQQMYLEIAPYVDKERALFYSWVEDGIIYFSQEKPGDINA